MLHVRTYTFTTTVSPMDDSDLARNFQTLRRRYWIRHGLWMPEDITVTFEKIKKKKRYTGKPALIAEFDGNKIRITPILKHVWVQAHTSLLHEMAHIYRVANFNDASHGKGFKEEIDRLYALGAFRKLI